MHAFQQLDFKKGTSLLSEVFFPIEKTSLITHNNINKDLNGIAIENYFAIVNVSNKKILSIVSRNYHVITNQQAYELGKKAFIQLFPSVSSEDLIPFKVIAPTTKSFCHIDLIHKDVNFTVWEQETWFPFIRITNSYNRTFALSFELGFVRKLCSNGVIFDKKTIKVKYNHSRGSIPVDISADVSQLKKLESEFIEHLLNLKRFHVHRKHSFPIICKALALEWKLNPKSPEYDNQIKRLKKFKDKSNELTDVYMKSEGENAFAVMNVMTDLISHQDIYSNIPLFSLRANQYYRRISNWMIEYCIEAEKRNFKIENYIEEYSYLI